MIINLYALLAGAVALLRLIIAGALVMLGWLAWHQWRRVADGEQKATLEERSHLLFLFACFLAGLNVVSWPLLYMLLQSYVPEWPGVMCIYGVMRIGTGSEGWSGYLPGLLGLLQILKPALVFLTGVWIVCYGAHRRSRTAWLLNSILLLLLCVGIVSCLDSLAEIAYLVIPKQNALLSSGCCPMPDRFTTAIAAHDAQSAQGASWWLTPLYFTSNLTLILFLQLYRNGLSRQRRLLEPILLLVFAIANLGISKTFVSEALTPAMLKMPGHHCVYDLIPRAPHVVLATILLAWGSLSMGWLVVAECLAGKKETATFQAKMVGNILRNGQYAYALSLALIACAFLKAR